MYEKPRVKVDFHCRSMKYRNTGNGIISTFVKLSFLYEKPRVNVKVERGSTFTFTRGFSYITSILIYARKAS